MGFLFCHWDRVKLIATNAWIYDIRRYMEITTIIDNQLLSVGVFVLSLIQSVLQKIMISICIVEASQFEFFTSWPTLTSAKQNKSIISEKQ